MGKIRKPSSSFIYIAGRPYGKLEMENDRLPRALREEEGDRILKMQGKGTYLSLHSAPHEGVPEIDPIAKTLTELLESEKVSVEAGHLWDWIYRFSFKVEDDFLKKCLERRDSYIDSSSGFDKYSAHWGTQPWGGLVLDISSEGSRIFRTKVDVFAPKYSDRIDKICSTLIVGIYSHRPECYHQSSGQWLFQYFTGR